MFPSQPFTSLGCTEDAFMATFEEMLDSLDPPIKHKVQHSGGKASLLLFDILLPAMVQCDLSVHQLNDQAQFQVIALRAVNELRSMGRMPPWLSCPSGAR